MWKRRRLQVNVCECQEPTGHQKECSSQREKLIMYDWLARLQSSNLISKYNLLVVCLLSVEKFMSPAE